MTRSLLFLPLLLAAAVLAAEQSPEVATRDLVIVPVEMPQAEEPAEGQALINWSTGVLRVTGRGRAKEGTTGAGRQRAQARWAAQNVALRNLAYALEGAPVTSDATFKEYLRRQGGKTGVRAFIKGQRFVETRDLGDGSMLATVEMALRGRRDLAETLFGEPRQEEPPTVRLREAGGDLPQGLTPAGADGPFTGLVVVADGAGADGAAPLHVRPALRVWLLDERGERLYGPGVATLEEAMAHGLVTYVRTVAAASRVGAVGDRPLVVRAAGINERNGSDLVLSADDAERVREADRQARFLRKAAVAFVLPSAGQ